MKKCSTERPGRLYILMSRRIADPIKAKGGATNYWLYDVGVQVCRCVFIKMSLSNTMLLCSHSNVSNIYTQVYRERSGSVVECLTRDKRVAGWSLTGVTALWSLSKTHLS